jgi:hypothetical protein
MLWWFLVCNLHIRTARPKWFFRHYSDPILSDRGQASVSSGVSRHALQLGMNCSVFARFWSSSELTGFAMPIAMTKALRTSRASPDLHGPSPAQACVETGMSGCPGSAPTGQFRIGSSPSLFGGFCLFAVNSTRFFRPEVLQERFGFSGRSFTNCGLFDRWIASTAFLPVASTSLTFVMDGATFRTQLASR